MLYHASTKLQDVYLHATLQQIDHLANEDVEMRVNALEVRWGGLTHWDPDLGTSDRLGELCNHRHKYSAALF